MKNDSITHKIYSLKKLKTLRTFQVHKHTFILENIREPFLRIVLKNYFLRIVFENIPKQALECSQSIFVFTNLS